MKHCTNVSCALRGIPINTERAACVGCQDTLADPMEAFIIGDVFGGLGSMFGSPNDPWSDFRARMAAA